MLIAKAVKKEHDGVYHRFLELFVISSVKLEEHEGKEGDVM